MYRHHERLQDLRVIARSRDKKRGMPRGIGGGEESCDART